MQKYGSLKYHYRAMAWRIDKENVISSPTPSSSGVGAVGAVGARAHPTF